MSKCDNKPKYLWAFVGFSFFTGLLSGFVINPAIDQLAPSVGLSSNASVYSLQLVINIIVGFIVFRFFVWYFITRPLAAPRADKEAQFTELGGGTLRR